MSQTLRKLVENELSGQHISTPPPQKLTFIELCSVYWRRWRRYKKRLFNAKAKREALEAPLKDFLFPVHRCMDRRNVPLNERSVILGKGHWPKQYKAGINKCWGIEIEWRDGLV